MNRCTRDVKDAIAGAQLPALPQCAIRLLQLSRHPAKGPREYAELIEADLGMSAQVLKFVNSSYFGFAREIPSVREAVLMIGLHPIVTFCLWRGVFALMPNPKCGPFTLQRLWQDSLRRALLSRTIAKRLKSADSEEAFAAGLLQDMALPVLAKRSPALYCAMLQTRDQSGTRLSALEREAFGWTHADAGAAMCRSWSFPESLASLIEGHLDDADPTAGPPNQTAVRLSARLPAGVDAHGHERALFDTEMRRIPLSPQLKSLELLAEVDREYGDFAPVLGIAVPPRSLVQWYAEAPDGQGSAVAQGTSAG